MEIKLTFSTPVKEVMTFIVKDREIYHTSKAFPERLRCIPKDEQFIKKIRESRNRLSPKLIDMFNLNEKQQEEYNEAKTSEELAEIIIKDCKKKGIILLNREVSDEKEK